MKIFPMLSILCSLVLSMPIASAQVIVPLGDLGDNLAVAYSGGGNFRTGDALSTISLGNINHLATQQFAMLKFDISQFEGQFATSVILNFPVGGVIGDSGGNYETQTVSVYAYNYEFGSAPFTLADASTPDVADVTFVTSQDLTGFSFTASFNLTAAFSAAQVAGFDYLAIQLVDTSIQGPTGGEAVFIYATLSPTLSVTANPIPEPSVYAMLGLASVMVVVRLKRRGLVACNVK